MAFDVEKAVKYVVDNAAASSQSLCAKYVRKALEAGGLDLSHHPGSAKDYGPTLLSKGFDDAFYFNGSVGYPTDKLKNCRVVNQCYQYEPKKGDVVVIQPYKDGGPHGHIALYTGSVWVSDFIQKDMWGGAGYREHKPTFTVYRP